MEVEAVMRAVRRVAVSLVVPTVVEVMAEATVVVATEEEAMEAERAVEEKEATRVAVGLVVEMEAGMMDEVTEVAGMEVGAMGVAKAVPYT